MIELSDTEKEVNYLRAGMSQHGPGEDWEMPEWVPALIRMRKTVSPDMVFMIGTNKFPIAFIHKEYKTHVNKWGAVSAITDDGKIGVRPSEFDCIEWMKNPHLST